MRDQLIVVDDGSIQLRDVEKHGARKTKECMSCYQEVGKQHEQKCRHQLDYAWSKALPKCDFRSISRDADRAFTRVSLMLDRFDPIEYQWIIAGQGQLDRRGNEPGNDRYVLRCYLGRNATDFEHDSAYAFQLTLYGVRFVHTWYGSTTLTAFIPPDLDIEDFRVPKAGYDPFKLEGTEICDDPNFYGPDHKPHPIVPEDCYVPKGDPKQLKLVRGRFVKIEFGYVHPEDLTSAE
jgi:hypothetical protein